jgi:hypothetical protein
MELIVYHKDSNTHGKINACAETGGQYSIQVVGNLALYLSLQMVAFVSGDGLNNALFVLCQLTIWCR